MAKIRSIKPEFWASEQIMACNRDARLLFIGLWNFCDDAGIHPASHKTLKAKVFPSDDLSEETIKSLVDSLIQNNLIESYCVDNKSYWRVITWKKHQRVNRPHYKYPVKHGCDIVETFSEHCSSTASTLLEHCSDTDQTELERGSNNPGIGIGIGTGNIYGSQSASTQEQVIQEIETQDQKDTEIEEVFTYWARIMSKRNPKLDAKRRKTIGFALKNYSLQQLKQAIDGCAKSSYHMGNNDQRKRYDGIDLIFRDAEHIEKFIEIDQTGQTPVGMSVKSSMLSQENADFFLGVV
jgi:hypothetical protein